MAVPWVVIPNEPFFLFFPANFCSKFRTVNKWFVPGLICGNKLHGSSSRNETVRFKLDCGQLGRITSAHEN